MNQRNYSGAFDHFRTSRAIDPHFCDVQYGFGQYYIARDNHAMARRSLRKAIHCPYVASNAFVRLQLVWSVLLAKPVLVPSIRQEMAEVRLHSSCLLRHTPHMSGGACRYSRRSEAWTLRQRIGEKSLSLP